MVDVLTEIMIDCPVQEVSSFAGDPLNATKWYVNIKEAKLMTPGPLTKGSRIAFTAHFLGRKLEYTYEVIEYIPGLKQVMQTAQGPFPMETIYAWEAASANSTKMTLRNRGRPTAFSRLMAPFMANAMRKANTKDLQRLKSLLEKK